jgi:inositol-phosphate transport system permease protein
MTAMRSGEHKSPRNRYLRLKREIPNVLSLVVMTVGSVPMALLFFWMVVVSFGDGGLVPTKFSLQNWSFLWSKLDLGYYSYPSIWILFANSLVIALGIAVLQVGGALFAGYALSRGRFPGKMILLQSTLLTHAFPAITGLIAAFYILNAIGLINTLAGIILLKSFGGLPMSTWIIKGFFDDVPRELEWASSIDGSSRIKTFFKVFLPFVWPGVLAIGLFAFLSGWGEYVMISVFIFDDRINTLSVIVRSLYSEESSQGFGIAMAVSTFYMLPCLLFYFFAQKSLMKMRI